MLFGIEEIRCPECAEVIVQAIHALDPSATVKVSYADRQVEVQGLISEPQAMNVLARAGYPVSPDVIIRPRRATAAASSLPGLPANPEH